MLEIFLSDIHFPYECKDSFQIAVNIIKDTKPDVVFLGGDIVDFYTVSSYSKDPARKLDWRKDKLHAIKQLEVLRKAAPNADFIYKEGNHTNRLERYIRDNAEALFEEDGLTIPVLLQLDKLNIKYESDDKWTYVGKLLHIHGHERPVSGVYPVKTMYDKLGTSFIMGHLHKFQQYSKRLLGHETHSAWMNGCLSNITPEYDMFPQWQNGITAIEYTKNGLFHVSPIIFVAPYKHGTKKCAVFNRKLYTANSVSKL